MILAFLMMASTSLVALDLTELEEKENNEADGRVGPDAEVVAILSPRETTTEAITGEVRNSIKAGEDVEFEVFVQNAGDASIEEMALTVTVYLSENGNRGNVAMDANGNQLSWRNGDVVCDDVQVCPWAELAAGDLLDNGKYAMTYQGAQITWTPAVGDYIVVVEAEALGDSDPANDYQEHLVSVTDWTDIILDLSWDSGKDVESGSTQKSFTLTATTGGSSDWSARNITVALDVQGTLSQTLNDNSGSDCNGGSMDILGVTTLPGTCFGTEGSVETFRHETDANNTTSASRVYMNFGDNSSWNGAVTPDASGDSGDYSISVSLVSYVVYGQQPECEEMVEELLNGTNMTVEVSRLHFCEVSKEQDDDASTSEDEITGMIETYHDIGITGFVINQGYQLDMDGEPEGVPSMPGLMSGPLNPGWGSVQATVQHRGSDLAVFYDWEVSFTIENTISGISETRSADSCMGGSGEDYVHAHLGLDPTNPSPAEPAGQACIYFDFTPGIYNVTATVSMVNPGNITDMSSSNDDADMYGLTAMNNRPSVTLTLETEGDIIRGPEQTITLVADAIDADDQTGLTLSYSWLHPGIPDGEVSECNGQGPAFSTCILIPFPDSAWASGNIYTVTATDGYGSSSIPASQDVFVWNHVTAFATTASGINMTYDLTYDGTADFTIAMTDSGTNYTQDLSSSWGNPPEDTGIIGSYDSVAVLDYAPSTTYSSVLAQSLEIDYDASAITPTSVWWISNGNWKMLDATITTAGSDGNIVIDVGTAVLGQGEIALMGGDLQMVDPPTANPTGLTMAASKGGDLDASWSIAGVAGANDWVMGEMCDSAGACTSTQYSVDTISMSMDGVDTTHGETYTLTLSLCNAGGCNSVTPSASAVADKMVDGDAAATEMTVADGEGAWTISWVVTGDATDVDHWKICWTNSEWTSPGDIPSTCVDATSESGGEVSKPGASGVYFFTAVAVDDKGNSNTAASMQSIQHTVVSTVTDCDTDPTLDGCDDVLDDGAESDGGVPPWTWGVIIGLVVVSFIGGAFILSRGGDGDDGKDWDY
tara:strand:+ start:5250 stop:8402 length:3153 start_codon:yes stop_codon:yes gene_type:complete